ncbi:hypothetical protein CORC01_09196 [Colletotrichum orchidophilum]|uniref:Uncharacterized protein n=1 Tax=Colletotrichum orchidophilum TaxID=1209926 RepID=A0A1G4B291_9PEZI|nr:uncharacterized protein CORC01_09196 [Colletotrichum orchidophilum]OHE95463.1 hypothetical protein CORC01_09196 [Colletotrichum orchidophilum]
MSERESGRPASMMGTHGVEQQPFWKAYNVPKEDDDVFQSYINRHNRKFPIALDAFQPKEDQISNWVKPPNPECFASFGDNGVTATVNAYGDLMQFSNYLGVSDSGIFSADHRDIDEPYWVGDRAEQLLEMRRDRRRMRVSYGLRIPIINLEQCRLLGYVHDRWPRYEVEDEPLGPKLTTQWMVHEKTILQQCLITNIGVAEAAVPIEFARGMRLQDLNFLKVFDEFDSLPRRITRFQTLSPNGYGWALVHPFLRKEVEEANLPPVDQTGTNPEDPPVELSDAIAVVVSVFIDGQAVMWNSNSLNGPDDTRLLVQSLKEKATMEVVTAYKMVHLTKASATWEEFLIPPAWADVNKHLASVSFTAFHPSDYGKPVAEIEEEKSGGVFARWMRSSLSANDTQPHGLPTDSLVNHIDFVGIECVLQQVCRTMVAEAYSESFIPSNSFTDTPFQLMKASEFSSLYNSKDDRDLARQVIRKVGKAWVDTLHKSDKRTSHVWPHAQDEGCNKYRLNEHVWIWRALRAIEDDRQRSSDTKKFPGHGQMALIEDPENGQENGKENGMGQRDRTNGYEEKLFRHFDSDVVQRDILRRFTVENDVSKKRMLATTRSSRETRFLLHASDTALFYGIERDFFLPTLIDEVWDNTIEAQVHHNENSETGWDNSMRYALAIMMGARKMRLNKRSPKGLVKTAFDVLFRTTSPNGLFYGQLDGTTKEPRLFARAEDRDFYFHASFEIPYILLTHCWKISSTLKDVSEKGPELSPGFTATKTTPQHPFNEVAEMITQQPKRQEHRSPTIQVPAAETVEAQSLSPSNYLGVKPKKPKVTAMKKSTPFNSLIDQSSIVDLEEEWLYNFPSFYESSHGGTVVTKAAEAYIREFPESEKFQGVNPDSFFKYLDNLALVGNIRKQKNLSKQQRASGDDVRYTKGNFDLFSACKLPRTAEKAKKRLIWLPKAVDESALVCYVNSSPDEQAAMSRFFDSHFHYENQFLEETTMVLNIWNSELHLSFHRLVEKNYEPHRGIPPLSCEELPGNAKWKLAQASMGFRISGDFFDRYWTCHFIEYIPGYGMREDARDNEPWDEQGWRQRKVLELLLFDRIMKQILRSTKGIFEMVKHELGDKRGVISFSALNSVEYLSSSTKWQTYQQILEVVEEELSDVLSTVSKWETREQDRGQERPRWTRNDERKYRGFIGKMQAATGRRIRDLQKQRSDIRSLKDQIIREQQQSRDNVSVIDAENVRLFTYVTVVFLPLGFAASIFSMSETPPHDVLKPMVVCSAVALALTFVALGNAKKVSTAINNYSHAKMNSSSMNPAHAIRRNDVRRSPKHHEEEAKVDEESEKDRKRGGPGSSHQINHKISFSGHIWFWVAYIFIDLPARRVLVAYSDLKAPKLKRWITYVHVIIGVIVLPVLLISRLLQFFVCIAMDLVQLAWGRSILPQSGLLEGLFFKVINHRVRHYSRHTRHSR